ncbi:ZIP family metal transporter [Caballeronia sp. DA-9]|uniref:ZIP family metal transporter n=1 Tax=Caballeronia sp. DA-9 TaxID=3436237 RepID=UPI003F672861
MPPSLKLALYTLPPVLAAIVGSALASASPPGPRTTSVIQHFTAGIVFAAAVLELLPQDRLHATAPVIMGFALGLALMLLLRKVSEWIEVRFGNSAFPTGLLLVTGVDLVVDGGVLGIAFAAGEQTGIILTIALTLEVLFLALSVSVAMSAAKVAKRWALTVPAGLALLLSASAIGGHEVFAGMSPKPYAVLLGFGTVALLYLVTEELLVEAHEVPETALATASFFFGFIVFFVIEAVVKIQ